jgi:hypothetical protein
LLRAGVEARRAVGRSGLEVACLIPCEALIFFSLDLSRSKLSDRVLDLELLELWSIPDDQENVDFNSIAPMEELLASGCWFPAIVL